MKRSNVKTRKGKDVTLTEYVPFINSGSVSTFPIRGVIRVSKRKTEYQIWTLDGMMHAPHPTPSIPFNGSILEKVNGVWYRTHPDDLVIGD